MKRRANGFTLIELLVAMSILAIVSLMAVQTLSGAIFQRDVLTRVDTQAAELARALALLRHDLEAIAPMPLSGDDSEMPLAVRVQPQSFSLMRGGVAALPGTVSGGFARVDWRVDAQGDLSRQITLTNGQRAPEGPDIVMLTGVSALRLSALHGELPSSDGPTDLPAGFELTLTHARFGPLRLVVAR